MLGSGLQHRSKVNRAPGGEASGVEMNFRCSDKEENLTYNKNMRETTLKVKNLKIRLWSEKHCKIKTDRFL